MSATVQIKDDSGAPEESGLAGLLKSAAPFNDLPAPVIKAIADASTLRRCLAGETIYSPGQFEGDEFFFVASGELSAAYADPDSGAMVIETVAAGGFLGLAAAVTGLGADRAELLTLTAAAESCIVAVESACFRTIVAQRPSLTRSLMHYFASAIAQGGALAASCETAPERRVYAALLEYIERDAVTGGWRVPRMPRHRELAERAGADETATANAVARLIQEGVARRDYPGLVIDDMPQLNRLAG